MLTRRAAAVRRPGPGPGPLACLVACLVACLLGLAACGGGGEDSPASEETTTSPSDESGSGSAEDGASTATDPYLPVPDGVELTAPGSGLSFGEAAAVAWQPRASTTGVLEVTVRALERAPLSAFSGFRLDPQTRASAAYFVRVRIANTGEEDLSGQEIPLYLLDETDTLIESSTFAGRFQPCPSTPFPDDFEPGTEITTCLVYLAPDKGAAEAVSFRPEPSFDPIVWTGEQTRYRVGDDGGSPE